MARKTDVKVNVNTAGRDELATVPGLGPSRAEAVIRLREARGGLSSLDELEAVAGIGRQKLARMRAHLTLGGNGEAKPEPAAKPTETAEPVVEKVGETLAEAGATVAETAEAVAGTAARALDEATTREAEAAGAAQAAVREQVDAAVAAGRRDVESAAASGHAFLDTVREANQAWLGLIQDQLWANLHTAHKLAGCRSPQELLETQADHLRSSMDRFAEESARLTELAGCMARRTLKPFETGTK